MVAWSENQVKATFVVRLPWRKRELPTNRELAGYVRAWLREKKPLLPDVPVGAERIAYWLEREEVNRAAEIAGLTVASFLRRLIRTYHRSVVEVRPSGQPSAQLAPAHAPAQIARPAPIRPPAPSDPTKTILLSLENVRDLLAWAGCSVAVQPTWRYFRRGDEILADQGNGQLVQITNLPMPPSASLGTRR